jgi:hypothetical protein
MTFFNVTAMVVIFALVLMLIRALFRMKREDDGTATDRVTLLDVKMRSEGRYVVVGEMVEGVEEVKLSDLAYLWRDDVCGIRPVSRAVGPAVQESLRAVRPGAGAETAPREVPQFASILTSNYWGAHGGEFTYQHREVVLDLLEILDREGAGAPSVLRSNMLDEPDNKYQQPQFERLERHSLLKHSLSVAQKIFEQTEERSLVYFSCAIAALGHDLGKLPVYRSAAFGLAPTHQAASAAIVSGVIGSKLGEQERAVILEGILHHHTMQKAGIVVTPLKKAGELVREAEVSIEGDLGPLPPRAFIQGLVPGEPDLPDNVQGASMPDRDETPVLGAERPGSAENGKIPLPGKLSWLDAGDLLLFLGKEVNLAPVGRRLGAFSMVDGMCYFPAEVLFERFREYAQARGCILDDYAANYKLREEVGLYLVGCFRAKGAVAEELLSRTGYCRKFTVERVGKETEIFQRPFVPLRASGLGVTIEELEARKTEKIKEIRSVRPS